MSEQPPEVRGPLTQHDPEEAEGRRRFGPYMAPVQRRQRTCTCGGSLHPFEVWVITNGVIWHMRCDSCPLTFEFPTYIDWIGQARREMEGE